MNQLQLYCWPCLGDLSAKIGFIKAWRQIIKSSERDGELISLLSTH